MPYQNMCDNVKSLFGGEIILNEYTYKRNP